MPHPPHSRNPQGPRLIAAGSALGLMLLAAAAPAAEIAGSAGLTTDYVWRGSSQSQGDPAVQAGFDVSGASGWYGAIWGSSVEFDPDTHASSEIDLAAGWRGDVAPDWGIDLNLTHYRYPSTTTDLDWTEAIATLTWKQAYWLQLGWSNDALASDESGLYAQLGTRLPIDDALHVEAAIGRYWLDAAAGESYSHAQLGAVWAFKPPFELRVTVHDTDSAARRLFPGLAGSRVEAALQASF